MIQAVEAGDADRVRELLAADPLSAHARRDGLSALMMARYRNQGAITEQLRAAVGALDVFEAATFDDVARLNEILAADPAAATSWSADGFTPLHLAAFFGGADGARALLDAGADPNVYSRNDFQVAPIHSAAAGREPVALVLVERGAHVNVRQLHGWTPLHSAAQNGFAALVDALHVAGADPNATNDDGTSPLDLAEAKGLTEIADHLRSAVSAPAVATAQ